MAVNWCYQEPWYTAANNSLLAYPSQPKPGYYAVQAACRPACASARLSKFSWKPGEIFDPQLWLLNDAPKALVGGRMEAFLELGGKTLHMGTWIFQDARENENLEGPKLCFTLPELKADSMTLVLKVESFSQYEARYVLKYS
jgi:beta-mannosidase